MSDSIATWTEVDYSEINGLTVERNQSNGNIKLSLMLSPMDVPTAWRHRIDKSNVAVIEFKYVSSHEPMISKRRGNLSFLIGKNSRRIYEIAVDVAAFISAGQKKGEVEIELKVREEALAEVSKLAHRHGFFKEQNAKAISNLLRPSHDSALTAG